MNSFSEWLTIASILVIVGVILEGHDLLIEIREKGWRPIWTKLGFSLLVIGLGLETFFQIKLQSADAQLKRQSDMKVGLLSVEARTAEGKIADAQKDAANANDRAGQANKAAAEAKERAAALEVQAADLERAISPRIIDQGQMSRSLRPFSGVTVRTLVVFDFEARRLGATLNVGLKMAGWNPFLLQNSSAKQAFPVPHTDGRIGALLVCGG